MSEILLRSDLPGLPEPTRGKVRDVYDLGDELLLVTTDRISAFDVILHEGVTDKGRVLNGLSRFWFEHFGRELALRHHALDSSWDALPAEVRDGGDAYRGRVLRGRKAKPLPIEWVVRGFITGSLWEQYERDEVVWDLGLPDGLEKGDRLEAPVFTPTTKAESGHDMPIDIPALEDILGRDLARDVRDRSLELFQGASAHAESCGAILVDTKLEWGLRDDALILIDECFTPDSSRFVLAETYEPGAPLQPFDKQLVRDFLLESGWDREGSPPHLPAEILAETRERYVTMHRMLTGTLPEGAD